MGDYKKWFIDGEEVSYREYMRAMKSGRNHRFKRYVKTFRMNELNNSSLIKALARYVLTDRRYIKGKEVFNTGSIRDVAERLVELEDKANEPKYYDYYGKLMG